jgi:4-amino-4-deoxy-L-arabinose transferase-like glycosyltransferase
MNVNAAAPDTVSAAESSASKAGWPSLGDVLLLGAILCVMSYGIGTYGLYEPHEGHFAGVGREMVTRGDWITPHLNGAPYLNKPPLFYWLIAISYKITGSQDEWSARIPLALIGWGGVLLAWYWARKLWGASAGRYAAVMLAVSSGWYLFCHQLLIDALLSVINLASLYFMSKAIVARTRKGPWVAFYAVVGLSVLAKGLIGICFPAAALLLFIAWRRDWALIRDSRPIMGVGIIILIVGPWVALLEHQNPGALYYMIINEHFKRALDTRWPRDYSVVQVSVIKFIGISLVWLAPWSLLVPQAWRTCRNTFGQNASSNISEYERVAVTVLAIGALLPVVAFLPMPSRLIYYSLPALPPFAMLAARWWSISSDAAARKDRLLAVACFLAVGGATFGAGFFLGEWLKNIPDLASRPSVLAMIPTLAFILGGALLLGGTLLGFRKPALAMLSMGVLLGAADIMNVGGFAAYDPVLSSKRLVTGLQRKIGKDFVWVSEGSKEVGASAGLAFYLGRDEQGQSRSVYIMSDDDRRPPPDFPGPKPAYLLNHEQLNEKWESDTPVLFITDFQRSSFLYDYPKLPSDLMDCGSIQDETCGNRRVYCNRAAWKVLHKNDAAPNTGDALATNQP